MFIVALQRKCGKLRYCFSLIDFNRKFFSLLRKKSIIDWGNLYTNTLRTENNLPDNSLLRISLLSMHCQYPFLTPNVAAFWREQEHEQWSLLDAIGDKFALKRLHSFWRLQDSNVPGNLKLSCSSLARVILTEVESAHTKRTWCNKNNTVKVHIPNFVSFAVNDICFVFLIARRKICRDECTCKLRACFVL